MLEDMILVDPTTEMALRRGSVRSINKSAKPSSLYYCPDHILQIALMANKYPNLFYLRGARRWWWRVICAEIAIFETIQTLCKQMINIKENY